MSETLRFAWFAPNAGNWVSFAMEHSVADALVGEGHEVTVIQCDGILDAYCPVMMPRGLSATSSRQAKALVCRDCRQAARIGREAGRYRTIQLSDLLTAADVRAVDEQVASVTQDTWANLTVDGIAIGRYAAYTAMLHHKTASITGTAAAWAEYVADLRNALLVSRVMPALLERIDPTHAVVYNALYPANRIFAETMLRRGVPLLNLSAGPTVPRRYSTLAVYDGLRASQTTVDSRAFQASMQVPCSDIEVQLVEAHLHSLMAGNDPWVYSAAATRRDAASVRAQLGVRPASAVATVIVSSPDETRSNMLVDAEFMRDPEAGYADAAEFLEECVALARSAPDVDFVFRMHPRMAPNKRETVRSPDLAIMDALLADLPDNAVVNYPSDGLSLYDLVTISSVAVNHTSSAGMEFLVFGIPAIQYDPARAGIYPLSFTFPVERHDREGFVAQLRAALASGASLDRSVGVFRWLAGWQVRSLVHLDPIPDRVEPPTATHAAEATVPRQSLVGRILPKAVKERIAQEIEGHRRRADLAGRTVPPEAVASLLAHVTAASVDGDVWEPPMLLPTGTSLPVERSAVADAVERLRRRLAIDDVQGVGVLLELSAGSADGDG